MSVSEKIPDGREAMLRAQIRRLAEAFDDCESLRDLKALSVELREANRELDEIKAPEKASQGPQTGVDELRARREAKRAARRA